MNNNESELQQNQAYYERGVRKAKTNIMWGIMFAIMMIFAGLTSAFLVSRGDGFWVSLQLPPSLITSTIVIALSSLTYILTVYFTKKNNKSLATIFIGVTFVLGLAFGWLQWKSYIEISEMGYPLTANIMDKRNPEEFNIRGEYGKDFTIFYGGNELSLENGQFFYMGEKGTQIDKEEYNEFVASKPAMVFGNKLLELKKGEVRDPKTKKMKTEYMALTWAKNVLTDSQKADLADHSNVAGSYFFVLLVAHYFHIILGLIFLIVLFFKVLTGRYNSEYYLGLKLGGHYWHFLGGLWLYLFFFLYLIH